MAGPLDFTVTATRHINQSLNVGSGKPNAGNDSSVGARMRFEADITLSGTVGPLADPAGLATTRWRFNPALWAIGGGRVGPNANVNYVCEIPASIIAGDLIGMTLQGQPQFLQANRNEWISAAANPVVEVVTQNTAILRYDYIVTMDMANFITESLKTNHDRLFLNHIASPQELQNATPSVFNSTTRTFTYRLEIEDGYGVVLFKFFSSPFESRWYAMSAPSDGLPVGLAETNGDAEIRLYRGGVEVTGLSVLEPTQVKLTFLDSVPYTSMPTAHVYLLNETNSNNYMLFQDNYGGDPHIPIVNTPGAGLIAGNIYSPSQVDAVEGANRVVSFWVGTDLTQAHTYAIAIVIGAYPSAGTNADSFTNSYIREGLPANQLPPPPSLGAGAITGTIIDYNIDPEKDNVASTVVDHLRMVVRIDTNAYDAITVPFAMSWDDDMVVIRITVLDEDDATVYWTSYLLKVAGVWQVATGDQNKVTVTDLGGGIIEYAVEFHMHHFNTAGRPDFAGKNLIHRWAFITKYPVYAWAVEYTYDQRVEVRGFGNFADVIDQINLFDYGTGQPLQSLCQSPLVLVEVLLDMTQVGSDTWNIRVHWDTPPHGYIEALTVRGDTLKPEEESYTSPPGFTQLDTDAIDLVPATFDGNGRAVFVFDHSLVPVGQRPRIYVIAEPEQVLVPGPCDGAYYRFTSSNASVTLGNSRSSTGYITVANAGGTTTLGSGVPGSFITGAMPVAPGTPNAFCAWSSDAAGVPSGNITYFTLSGQGLTAFTQMATDASLLLTLNLTNNALPAATVDSVLNNLNSALAAGLVDLSGGTNGAPTAASAAAVFALNANGWTINTN